MLLTREELRIAIMEQLIEPRAVDLFISPGLERCERNRSLILDFCKFCADNLSIDHDVSVRIVDNREKENISTTAFYNPENHDIGIYGKNRAVVDICRSIAHEMTHMSQMLEGRIEFPVQDAGGEIEDEANARAGEIIKLFAKSNDSRMSIYESVFR